MRKLSFYETREWKELRYTVLRKNKWKCCSCGADRLSGRELHVDHIKPRSKYPEFELVEDNLQVLCRICNEGKSNKYEDDLRIRPKKNRKFKSLNAHQKILRIKARFSVYVASKIRTSECAKDEETTKRLINYYLGIHKDPRLPMKPFGDSA